VTQTLYYSFQRIQNVTVTQMELKIIKNGEVNSFQNHNQNKERVFICFFYPGTWVYTTSKPGDRDVA